MTATAWINPASGAAEVTPALQPASISALPLHARVPATPTLTLAVSGARSIAGMQHHGPFVEGHDYWGNFDSQSCYDYITHHPQHGNFFQPNGRASSQRTCGGSGFSGSFLNWASASTLDGIRLGITGGDRHIDLLNFTVLQRTMLGADFFQDAVLFPKKTVTASVARHHLPRQLFAADPQLSTHDVHIINCLNRIYIFANGSNNLEAGASACTSPPSFVTLAATTSSPAIAPTEYLARVSVCASSGEQLLDSRYWLCQRYPSGYYKPTGIVQSQATAARIAAFGYLQDAASQRYGGVLRVPMPRVSAQSHTAESALEWDAQTGILHANPHQAAEGSSGVIQYLNQLGKQTGAASYETHDPVGELYYESLRYLQGLPPTPEAHAGMLTEMKANFPVHQPWTDPWAHTSSAQSHACLRNSVLLIGDSAAHADHSLPGNTHHTANDFARSTAPHQNLPDFAYWTRLVGAFEAGTSMAYSDATGQIRTTSAPQALRQPFLADLDRLSIVPHDGSYSWVGAAYWARNYDIRGKQWMASAHHQRPGLRVSTYTLDVQAGHRSAEAAYRWRSSLFLAAKYGGFDDPDADGHPYTPPSAAPSAIAPHWGRNLYSREAKNYLSLAQPQTWRRTLQALTQPLVQPGTSLAGTAIASATQGASAHFSWEASFNTEAWSGDVVQRRWITGASGLLWDPDWIPKSAAQALDALPDSALLQRKIYLGAGDTAKALVWDALSATERAIWERVHPHAEPDGLGHDRLQFVRGERRLEGSLFVRRSSRLGPIFHSGTVHVGAPSTPHANPAFRQFQRLHAQRTPTVYVGAMDGMLHAFDAQSMHELFAYIPSWNLPRLTQLGEGPSPRLQRPGVDATPAVADVELEQGWATVLVGGSGLSGKGVYALDVTDPEHFNAAKVLWEFTDADDPRLGHVMTAPRLWKLRTQAQPPFQDQWFAVVASGIHHAVADAHVPAHAQPSLFLLSLAKPRHEAWQRGLNYFRIDLPLHTDASSSATELPGVLGFNATSHADGSVNHVYVGDLHGQLWKLDMHNAPLRRQTHQSWSIHDVSYYKNSQGLAKPMFVARGSTGSHQAISMPPALLHGPQGSVLVAFGTGRYLEPQDNVVDSRTWPESFYVLYDSGEKNLDTLGDAHFNGRNRLQPASVSPSRQLAITSFTWTAPHRIITTRQKAGWYLDLPSSGPAGGERLIASAAVLGQEVVFNTLLPADTQTGPCATSRSHTYQLNLHNGAGTVSLSSTVALGAPVIVPLTPDIPPNVSSPQNRRADRFAILHPSAKGMDLTQSQIHTTAPYTTGRLSWRQIYNYPELRRRSWPP